MVKKKPVTSATGGGVRDPKAESYGRVNWEDIPVAKKAAHHAKAAAHHAAAARHHAAAAMGGGKKRKRKGGGKKRKGKGAATATSGGRHALAL